MYIIIDKNGLAYKSDKIITDNECATFNEDGDFVAGHLSEEEQIALSLDRFDPPMLQHAFYKAERNEKCPCGSGKKFKKCNPHYNNKAIELFNKAASVRIYKKPFNSLHTMMAMLSISNFER